MKRRRSSADGGTKTGALHSAHVRAWLDLLHMKIRDRSHLDADCWIWKLCYSNRGRGRAGGVPVMAIPNRGGILPVRRVAAMVAGHGLTPQLVVATSCGNPRCVNPAHMRPVSRSESSRLAVKRGRYNVGRPASALRLAAARSNPHVIVSIELARAIRTRYADVGNALAVAKEFGLKHDHAHKIIRGKLWREASPFPQPAP